MPTHVDNHGIGALYTGENYDLDESNLGGAVALSGNNEIILGSDGTRLLGRLVHVSDGAATVQIKGVVRLFINSEKPIPSFGDGVVVDGKGCVYQAPAAPGVPAGGCIARGITTAHIDGVCCDVIL